MATTETQDMQEEQLESDIGLALFTTSDSGADESNSLTGDQQMEGTSDAGALGGGNGDGADEGDQSGEARQNENATPREDGSGRRTKPELSVEALAKVKGTLKLYGIITGFDEQSDHQRAVVRDLMVKHAKAMEMKLAGVKPAEGEDFESITKLLKKENNRLDSMLEGKESLFGKTRVAAEEAIKALQAIVDDVKRMEEAG